MKGYKLGFAGCGKRFDSYNIFGDNVAKKVPEEGDVYYKAMKLGYEDLEEFEKAASKGWGNVEREKYWATLKTGFKNYGEYSKAKEMHLDNDAWLYNEAKEMRLKDQKEFDVYARLKRVKEQHQFDSFDKAQVYEILERGNLAAGMSLPGHLQ